MNSQKKHSTLTFILLRDVNRTPIQFKLNVYILIFIPLLITALSLACIHFYQQYSAYTQQNSLLQAQLSDKQKTLANVVEVKDQTIEELQSEIVSLSIQADEVKHRVEELKQLEQDLTELTQSDTTAALEQESRNEVSIASSSAHPKKVPNTNDENPAELYENATGGQHFSVNHITGLAATTSLEYIQLNDSIEELNVNLNLAKKQVVAHQEKLKITPSIWPTQSTRVTSSYGYRSDPFTKAKSFHTGIDIGGNYNESIYATADGKITASYYDYAKGNYIVVDHSNGILTRYMHLSKRLVKVGDTVQKGDEIGLLGSTGRSTGAHLHYEVIVNDKVVDPKPYMVTPN